MVNVWVGSKLFYLRLLTPVVLLLVYYLIKIGSTECLVGCVFNCLLLFIVFDDFVWFDYLLFAICLIGCLLLRLFGFAVLVVYLLVFACVLFGDYCLFVN